MGWVMGLLPVALLVAGFPFFLVLLATVIVALAFFAGVPTTAAHQVMFGALDKYALLAVPFFLFAGDLLGRGGVSVRIVRWVQALIGRARGSLPFTSLGTAVVFSAISGSTAATVAAVGSLTYKRLREKGYSEKFSTGLLIAAGAIDNLIPPSIGFILYGIASETSIVKLFAAGAIPGLVLAAAFAVYIYRHAVATGDTGGPPFRLGEFVDATRDGFWAIAAPVAVLGGIYAGIFSPTEAAGVACVYAILVTWLIYREAKLKDIFDSASRSMYLTAQVFIILACAGVYSWLLTVSGVGPSLIAGITDLQLPPWAFLLAVNILLLAGRHGPRHGVGHPRPDAAPRAHCQGRRHRPHPLRRGRHHEPEHRHLHAALRPQHLRRPGGIQGAAFEHLPRPGALHRLRHRRAGGSDLRAAAIAVDPALCVIYLGFVVHTPSK